MTDTSRRPPSAQFGEEGSRLSYGSYLNLPRLLSSQEPQTGDDGSPPAHDELLFITVHQVYELWFQQLLHDLTAARDAMCAGELWWAGHLLDRAHEIERVLVAQITVLETMTPQDFLLFRQQLAPASGFQSVQFRELEFLSGAKDRAYVERFRDLTDDERTRLERRLSEPTLWDAFLQVLQGRGLEVGSQDTLTESLRTVAHDRAAYADVWALAEALLDHDELSTLWRARHVLMVERMIGTKAGTGGSSGAAYLRTRIDMRYYPLLWALRTVL